MIKILLAALLVFPRFAFAHPDASVCREEARHWVQFNLDTYVKLAHQYPQDFGKYVCYEGQQVKFVSESYLSQFQGVPAYAYKFSSRCDGVLEMHAVEYDFRQGHLCQIRGE